MNNSIRRLFVVLATGSAIAMGVAQAQSPTPRQAAVATAPAGPQLTIRDVYDRMEAAGYRDMREIEYSRKHKRYEVKGYDAQGVRVKLYVNADTGAVERSRVDD
jgi:hypothetical protein